MNYFRFLLNLPWWAGLALYLAGAWLVVHWFAIGILVALFGVWTFSRMLEQDKDITGVFSALIGLPLFILVMLIPERFTFETPVLDLLNGLSSTFTFAMRAALGLFAGIIAFQSVK